MSIWYLLINLAYFLRSVSSDATQTIASLDAYMQQRSCATVCFWNGDPNNSNAQDVLGIRLECCPQVTCKGNAKDACYCRPDLRDSAVSWLSTCVIHQCSETADFSSAVSIYDEYCKDKRDVPSSLPVTKATTTADSEPEDTASDRDLASQPTAPNTASNRDSGDKATATVTVSVPSSSAVSLASDAYVLVRSHSIESLISSVLTLWAALFLDSGPRFEHSRVILAQENCPILLVLHRVRGGVASTGLVSIGISDTSYA